MEYKKRVREIEADLYANHFRDGIRYDYEQLLSKLDLPEDLELRIIPEPPPKDLVLPEEEDEEIPNPEDQANPADQAETLMLLPTLRMTLSPFLRNT